MTAGGVGLPAGWQLTTIGAVCSKPQYGWTTSAAQSGDIKLLRTTDITSGVIDWNAIPFCREAPADTEKYLLADGDIVVSRAGSVGVSHRVMRPERSVFASYLIRFKPKPMIDGAFLAYLLQSPAYWAQVLGQTAGIAIPNVNASKLEAFEIPVPPLGEQRRIVSEIEKQFTRLDAGLASLRLVQAKLKRYRAAVLKVACEGRLVPTEAELAGKNGHDYETGEQLLARILTERRKETTGRGKYKEPLIPDTAVAFRLPVGWALATLDAVAEIKGGITKDQKRKHSVPARFVDYLRVANVQRGYLDLAEVKQILATEQEIEELSLRTVDVLFNEGGDRDKLGRGWVWNGELNECIHQNHVFRARLLDAGLNPRFVSWYANTSGQKFFFDEGKHTTNLASISMSRLKGLPVPIPPPAEQERIVTEVDRRLSVIDALEQVVSANLQRAARLRQSILDRAFSGRLLTTTIVAVSSQYRDEAARKKARHFARTLLSAEIVHRLHKEPTFGHVKLQKIFHLCEHIAQLPDIAGEYTRQAAGPLDNRSMYATQATLKKLQWYRDVPRAGFGHQYIPMARAGGHREYIERWPGEKLEVVEHLIELMRKWDTEQCEIFSTVYAAWNDLIMAGGVVSDDTVLDEVLSRWHDQKRRIPSDRWRRAIYWMRQEGFIPTGFGRLTRTKS
jgi:type I restriction enzyme S subunit